MTVMNPTLAAAATALLKPLDDADLQPADPVAVPTPLDWVRELLAASTSLNVHSADDGVIDAQGAPMLPGPLTDFSGDELALLLSAIDTKMKDTQARTAKEGIELVRVQKSSANQEMLDKLQEAITQKQEAAEKEKSQKVWGWIGKIAAFIGAVVAVVVGAAAAVVSGGAGVALLAIAVIGLVAATIDLASQINQEIHPDAEPFTLGSLIGNAVLAQMDKDGTGGQGRAAASGLMVVIGLLLLQPDLTGQMAEDSALSDGRSADFASHLRTGMMFAGVVVTVVATIASTIASGGASSSKLVSDTAKNAMTAATWLQATATLTSGAAQVGSGATSIAVAIDTRDAEKARAAAKAIEATLAELSAQSDEQTQRLRDIIEALQEGSLMFSQMVNTASDQRANIVRSVVRA